MTLNGLSAAFKHETVWLEANRYSEAERDYHIYLSRQNASRVKGVKTTASEDNASISSTDKPFSSMSLEIAKARETIKNLFPVSIESCQTDVSEKIRALEESNKALNQKLLAMTKRVDGLEELLNEVITSLKKTKIESKETKPQGNADKNGVAESDDDIDLFGSDEETEEDARIKEERVKAYSEKKAKKPALVAKSSVVLDVKPWDDETNMKALETAVRQINTPGLLWGASKLVPLAYGIKKLQIVAIVEDDKVSIDWLQEAIQENEDLVQSVDVAAFNKL